jgi:hypothetical protein
MSDYPFRYLGAVAPMGPEWSYRLVRGVVFVERRGVGLVATMSPQELAEAIENGEEWADVGDEESEPD